MKSHLESCLDDNIEAYSESFADSCSRGCLEECTECNSENYSGIDTDNSSGKRLKADCCHERSFKDELFMKKAIVRAKTASKHGEVPVGAVIVQNGVVIADGRNMREGKENALAHAEIIAIKKACKKLKNWRLDDCEIYVTMEPCMMCSGAIEQSRIKKIIPRINFFILGIILLIKSFV